MNKSRKPIICFEGPSGIGKTTMCSSLNKVCNIVPEVNLLYDRKGNEEEYWYVKKQVERFQLCINSNQMSILDGDAFQPIWYNWAYNYKQNFLPKKETNYFFRNQIKLGAIAFPDLYIVFNIDEEILRERKEKDKNRTRRNFEKHLKMIAPMRRYFQFLNQETDLNFCFITFDDFSSTKEKVLKKISDITLGEIEQLKTFTQIEHWLNENNSGIRWK